MKLEHSSKDRVRPAIAAMTGYVPGEQLNDPSIIKLNTNENPYPPSPRVFAAIQECLTSDKLRKYPQPTGSTFRYAAADVLKVDPDSILIGNGSDDVLTVLTRTFVPERGIVAACTPSYLLYRNLAEIQGAQFLELPWAEGWQLPSPSQASQANLFFLPNPNSPSGTVARLEQVQTFASQLPGLLVLDEAYADFAEEQGTRLLSVLSNLIITRSFSKYYALAGIRFGFAIMKPELVRECNKVKDSYNCDVLSLAAATAAIEDEAYYNDLRAKILATRGRLTVGLCELGFQVIPSAANFVWCQHEQHDSKQLFESLKVRKILVRHMRYPNLEGLRITVGTNSEVNTLLSELKKLV